MNNDYGSYVLLKGGSTVTENVQDGSDCDSEEERECNGNGGDPSMVLAETSEYQSTLMTVACGGEVPKGVLSYRNATPSNQIRQGSSIDNTFVLAWFQQEEMKAIYVGNLQYREKCVFVLEYKHTLPEYCAFQRRITSHCYTCTCNYSSHRVISKLHW